MRFRTTLMLTAVVSISAIFALNCSAMQASPDRYAQNQGQVQGQTPPPVQSQSQRQVNDRVRELQQQYKDLLKHEYNPAKFHPKASEKPSFNKPGWLNHSRPRARRRAWRSRARHTVYRRRSTKYWRKRGRKSELRRSPKKWTRRRAVSRRKRVRSRKGEMRRPHRPVKTYSRRRTGHRRSIASNHSAAGKSRSHRASAKKGTRGHRSVKASRRRVNKRAGRRIVRRNPDKYHVREKKHKK